jgi:DNA polymerase-1
MTYSLSSLTLHYKCSETKQSELLHDYAWETGLYQQKQLAKTSRNCFVRPSDAVLTKWCYQNMTLFPDDVIGKYCLQDIHATKSLYNYLIRFVTEDQLVTYSDLIKVCIDTKKRGVRIDLAKARELDLRFSTIAEEALQDVKNLLDNQEINVNSTKQLTDILILKGYDLPTTEKGTPSLTSEWLEEQNLPIFTAIRRYRKALKVQRDFVQKLVDYQEIFPKEAITNNKGWLFPSLKPLGATLTGRFTSGGGAGCKELSIHQIPRRDEEFGAPVRELFIAHEGEQVVCCDFSAQESRLQVHYAKILGCKGIDSIVDAWKAEPTMKYHKKVAEMTGLDYETAKMVNLALSYGMHTKKLSVKMGIEFEEAQAVLKQYHQLLPFMQQLQNITSRNILKLGYIKTIGGRKLKIDPPYNWMGRLRTNESKALSKLIQGSAADQCIRSMINAWKNGLNIMFSVHDEIIISTRNDLLDLLRLRTCMEYSYPLEVPMVAEGGVGSSWGEAK